MGISGKSLKKLSKRIRNGGRDPNDILLIEEYRDSKLVKLYQLLVEMNAYLQIKGFRYLVTGRAKRVKSIIRKLERAEGMYIDRMVDIVGVRIIVNSLEDQDGIISELDGSFSFVTRDYRDRVEGYRAVHLYVENDGEVMEVQIRTLPQQLWANESEMLGEKVKEGGGTKEERKYLNDLAKACILLDCKKPVDGELEGIGAYRGVLLGRYPHLKDCFEHAQYGGESFKYYLIVFDCRTNELLKYDEYTFEEGEDAVKEFCRYTKLLNQDNYDVLFLNTTKLKSLQVTHPIYFPIM